MRVLQFSVWGQLIGRNDLVDINAERFGFFRFAKPGRFFLGPALPSFSVFGMRFALIDLFIVAGAFSRSLKIGTRWLKAAATDKQASK